MFQLKHHPLTTQPSDYVSRETPTTLKHDETTTTNHPKQTTTFHVKQSQLWNHERKAENSRLETPLSLTNYSHDQCFTWNINWSFKLSHTSKPQNPTNTSKQITSIPTALTFHVKHQASATNRGKATHPKRYLLQLNHPIMFHVKPLFHIPHSTNLRFTWNIGKAQK